MRRLSERLCCDIRKFDTRKDAMMDLGVIKSFLDDRLTTKVAVQRAAEVMGVSSATMYRYKANPEAMGLGHLVRLSGHLGLPLTNGAAWSKTSIVESERRRLDLESTLVRGKAEGRRLVTVPAYTVNSEISEVSDLILQADYGTRMTAIGAELTAIRAERSRLYDDPGYESWEIWNGFGYMDFFHGRDRFKSIPAESREAQIRHFIDSSENPKRHRFVYLRHSPDLPMFGCYTPEGVVLVRIDDIHLEFRDSALFDSFEDTFNDFRQRCVTVTREDFISFLKDPRD